GLVRLRVAIGGLGIGLAAAPGSFSATKGLVSSLFQKGGEPRATVNGRVRLSGLPVAYARVELRSQGDSHVVQTGRDGSFQLEDVPAGSYQVTIHPPTQAPSEPEDEEPAALVDVPERYRDAATSGLHLDLVPGTQSRSLVLTH